MSLSVLTGFTSCLIDAACSTPDIADAGSNTACVAGELFQASHAERSSGVSGHRSIPRWVAFLVGTVEEESGDKTRYLVGSR